MKLTANLIRGKKGSLEEGPMRDGSSNDNSEANRLGNNYNCDGCVQFMKVISYLLFVLSILFIGWIVLVYFALNSAPAMCTELEITNGILPAKDYDDFDGLSWDNSTDTAIPEDSMASTQSSVTSTEYDVEDFMATETTTTSSMGKVGDRDLKEFILQRLRAIYDARQAAINRRFHSTTEKVESEQDGSTETEIPIIGTSNNPNKDDPFYSVFESLSQTTIVPSTTTEDYLDRSYPIEDPIYLSYESYSDEDGIDDYNPPNDEDDTASPQGKRLIRSINDVKNVHEKCVDSLTSVHGMIDKLGSLIISGETSEPIVLELRQKFRDAVIILFRNAMLDSSESTWRSFCADVNNDHKMRGLLFITRTYVMLSVNSENDHLFQQSEPLTQEMVHKFRRIAEKVVVDHEKCLHALQQKLPEHSTITPENIL